MQARPPHGRQGSRFSYPLKRHGFVGEENLRPSRSQSIHRLVDWAVHWSGLLGALASVACWRRPVPAREELWCYAPVRLRFQRSSSPLCWRCASQASVGWLAGSSSSSFLWAGWLALLFRPFRLVGWFCPRAVAGPLVGKGRLRRCERRGAERRQESGPQRAAASCSPPLAPLVPVSEPARAFEVDLQGDPGRSPGREQRSRGSDRGGRQRLNPPIPLPSSSSLG